MRIPITLTNSSEEIITHILDSNQYLSRSQVLTAALEAGLRKVWQDLSSPSVPLVIVPADQAPNTTPPVVREGSFLWAYPNYYSMSPDEQVAALNEFGVVPVETTRCRPCEAKGVYTVYAGPDCPRCAAATEEIDMVLPPGETLGSLAKAGNPRAIHIVKELLKRQHGLGDAAAEGAIFGGAQTAPVAANPFEGNDG